jgi:hypothetical protein
MPDGMTYTPRVSPLAPSLTARRAGQLTDAALLLRLIQSEMVARGHRDPACFIPALADALEAMAEGDDATARDCMAMWARVGA